MGKKKKSKKSELTPEDIAAMERQQKKVLSICYTMHYTHTAHMIFLNAFTVQRPQ